MADVKSGLLKELTFQLRGGNAHAPFEKVVADFPVKSRGVAPEGMPYSGWQLLEHIRIAQRDMLEFCTNGNGSGYKHKKWPDAYWPTSPEPENQEAWEQSVKQVEEDREEFIAVLTDPKADLFAALPWGDGQTLFHEACLVVDHNAYHLGELVALRRVLGIWK